ncbi:MAG TPA: DAK2 domain-containing protein [Ruminiclostridium sp.]
MVYTIQNVKRVLDLSSDALIVSKVRLTQLDSDSGDGDLGISMEKGALALKAEVNVYTGDDIGELLVKCAMSFNKVAPSTMGTLLSNAIMTLGKNYRGNKEIDDKDTVKVPRIMLEAIMKLGKASLGDKTILDALIPLAEIFEESFDTNLDIKLAMREAASAAEIGANETKGMLAKVGRTKWIAERTKGYPDGGAILCSIVAQALVND